VSQAVIEFYEGVLGPKALAHIFSGDDLSGPLHQNCEQAVGQILQLQLVALASKRGLIGIKLERTKPVYGLLVRLPRRHGLPFGHEW
jgi:hypothetical protein